ncbi:MAG: hypothetical protein GY870_00710, partial [archaeon]|nr:hypothetical protein [archaeon]
DKIRENRIEPVINKIREVVEKEIDENPDEYLNYTPCYRCAVPIPPAAKMAAACTLKGIPRNRTQCALKSEIIFYNDFKRKVDYTKNEDVLKLTEIAQKELDELRKRVLEENISPEEKDTITPEEIENRRQNIKLAFGSDFSPEDMENIIGNKIPAVQTVSSIIASMESQEALKLIFSMQGVNVGTIMSPAYINYNGVYGQFDAIPMGKRLDCVACGDIEGVENLSLVVPKEGTFQTLFDLIEQQGFKLDPEKWSISDSMTKVFIYLPGNPNSPKISDQTKEKISSGSFVKFATAPSNAVNDIYIFNVQIINED